MFYDCFFNNDNADDDTLYDFQVEKMKEARSKTSVFQALLLILEVGGNITAFF